MASWGKEYNVKLKAFNFLQQLKRLRKHELCKYSKSKIVTKTQ